VGEGTEVAAVREGFEEVGLLFSFALSYFVLVHGEERRAKVKVKFKGRGKRWKG